MSNSIASKIPEGRINNLKGFSSVNSEIHQNTHCLLTVSRISSIIFQKVRMAAFVHSLEGERGKEEEGRRENSTEHLVCERAMKIELVWVVH